MLLGLGALAEAALHHLFEPVFAAWGMGAAWAEAWRSVALLIVSYLHVVVGEMIQNIAIAGPERSALLLVPPLYAITRAAPHRDRDGDVAKALVRLFGIEPKDEISSAYRGGGGPYRRRVPSRGAHRSRDTAWSQDAGVLRQGSLAMSRSGSRG